MPSVALRSAAVENFLRIAEEDPRIVAAFLGGSLASGLSDQYSDIDMYYVIDPSEYESFHSSVKSLIDGLGPVAYFDEHNNFGFDLVLFMLTNGTKGELGLGETASLVLVLVRNSPHSNSSRPFVVGTVSPQYNAQSLVQPTEILIQSSTRRKDRQVPSAATAP